MAAMVASIGMGMVIGCEENSEPAPSREPERATAESGSPQTTAGEPATAEPAAADVAGGAQRGRAVRKGGGRPRMAAGADEVMHRFQGALAREDWDAALECCIQPIREAAKEYDTPGRFFEVVVPVAPIVALEEIPICSSRTGGRDATPSPGWYYESFVRIAEKHGTPTISWTWRAERFSTSWLIRFEPKPLNEFIDQELRQKLQREAVMQKAIARLVPKLDGLHTRLTARRDTVKAGEPILLTLELVNDGRYELQYDDQQAAVNDSLEMLDSAANHVPYVAQFVQTGGAHRPIKPGEAVVLFENLDLAGQYDVRKPGRYIVWYSGRGLSVGHKEDLPGIPVQDVPPPSGFGVVCTSRLFPSNTVTITVTP
jgi:hypothetical protein